MASWNALRQKTVKHGEELGLTVLDRRNHMINLKQDTEGFVRMNRHFPQKLALSITFTDGTQEETTGRRMNELYDAALAEYRLQNNMDTKGFSRSLVKIHRKNAVGFVPVQPGLNK
ncbi:hypothetical protein [Paeniglutamicibacter gangotriensis]|nr:hypothetical protein [Paeniglutamicibacter gangotriensis]